MGEADSTLWVSCLSPVSDTQVRIHSAQQDSPVSKIIFTLFSSFLGGPSLSITDQDWGRDFMDEADPIAGQLLVTHLLYTVQDLFSTARQSSFQNSFHTLHLFLVDQVLAIHRSRLRKILHGWSHLHCGLVTGLLSKVQNLFSATRQSKSRNSFHTFLFCFCQTDS